MPGAAPSGAFLILFRAALSIAYGGRSVGDPRVVSDHVVHTEVGWLAANQAVTTIVPCICEWKEQ
jgi:hypothetical protein